MKLAQNRILSFRLGDDEDAAVLTSGSVGRVLVGESV
jgi:hypothetical protein